MATREELERWIEGLRKEGVTLREERKELQAALAARTQQRDALRESMAAMLEVFDGYELTAALPIDVREKAQAALALVRDE